MIFIHCLLYHDHGVSRLIIIKQHIGKEYSAISSEHPKKDNKDTHSEHVRAC